MAVVKAARKWLAGTGSGLDDEEEVEADTSANGPSGATRTMGFDPDLAVPEELAGMTMDFEDPEFKHAFGDIPNKYSPQAVAMYMTYKVFVCKLKMGTADTARAALKQLWASQEGGKYRGSWKYDEATGACSGNPIHSANVDDTTKSLRNATNADGSPRTHSLAMSKANMDKIYEFHRTRFPDDTVFFEPSTSAEETKVRTKHLGFMAISTLMWTLWLRSFEATKIQRKHLVMDLEDPQSFNTPYFEVKVVNRKGWQNKLNSREQDLRSGTYKVAPQPNLPACDAYHWVRLWIRYLEEVVYRRPLAPDDYLFPSVGANGVRVGDHLSHDDLQKWLDYFSEGAKLPRANGNYTTHCWRRGGAQYRFMFAPVGSRWTLEQVRWWGGWAEGEHRNTMIKYLLDEVYAYEHDHSGLLLQNQPDRGGTFLGEGSAMAAATNQQLTMMHSSLSQDLRYLIGLFSKLATQPKYPEPAALPSPIVPATRVVPFAPSPLAPFTYSFRLPTSPLTRPIEPIPLSSSQHLIHGPSSAVPPPVPAPAAPLLQASTTDPYFTIPRVPLMVNNKKTDKSESWRIIVEHCFIGAPHLGLPKALIDWPPRWYQGANARWAQVRGERLTIGLEYRDRQVYIIFHPSVLLIPSL
ncbi:hypothetical protein MKEN_00282200 [Mycena kentingensis (nom. inval.)]|nr:hypothetical protein MKEN_00282200 [Mycena kentingensis (nom. inval.)]